MKQIFLLIYFFCSSAFCLQGQNFLLKGRIYDSQTQASIERANIVILQTSLGVSSDKEGNFSIQLPNFQKVTLKISCIGYETLQKEIRVSEQSEELAMPMRPAVFSLHKEVIVSANRYEQNEFETNAVTSVVSATQLVGNTLRSTPEILIGTTGVFVQKTNHGGGSPFIRGLTGQQTLLMIDGIRLNNATFRSGPNQYFNTIDPLSLERIEVVRGAGSVQYGSDAIGGLVQVLTKNPTFADKLTINGNLYGKMMSSGMEQSGRGEIELSNKNIAVQTGLSYRNFGDMLAGGGKGKLTPTGYNELAFNTKARFRLSNNYLLTLNYQYVEQNQVPLYHRVVLENYQYSYFDPQDRQLFYARLSGFYQNRLFQKVELTYSYHFSHEGRYNRRNQSQTLVYEEDKTRTQALIFQVHSAPARFWEIQSGAEYYFDKVSSMRLESNGQTLTKIYKRGLYPNNSTMDNLAFFTLHQFRFTQFNISSGLRYNFIRLSIPEQTIGKTVISPSALVGDVSLAYQFHKNHKLIASANTAFRSPNIDDLGTLGIVDFRYELPTNNLQPEKSLNTQIAWKANAGRFSSSLAVFQNQLSNLINRVRQGRDSIQGYQVYRKENVAEAVIRGTEAEFAYQISSKFTFLGNITYLYGQNKTNNEPVRRIPPVNGKLSLFYSQKQFYANLEYLFAGKQDRLAQGDKDDNRIGKDGTPSWNVVNLYLGYTYKNIRLVGGLGNIFNELYRIHGSGVDGYGRHFWLTARLQF
jgi:iron complex outermembrane receptor protein/hemoglobin/transferrin/lactoferrin receptor protein